MNSDESCTPPEIMEAANLAALDLLPQKSKYKYEFAYKRFMDYRLTKNIQSFSENVCMAYFAELNTKMKSSTLWSNYSMLRSTLVAKQNVDISKFQKLRAYLKRKSVGYQSKKSKILSKEQLEQFILEAPDELFLTTKVALIFGIAGACRREELAHMTVADIEDLGTKLLIKIPYNKTNTPRSFIVNQKFLEKYKKYVSFRPKDYDNPRFFFKFTKGKAFKQVVGINQFGKMPQNVASYLNLANPNEYTGHCFRRSSATILVDSGANLTCLKRHGGWKSGTTAESYIDESINNKIEVADKIFKPTTTHFNVNDFINAAGPSSTVVSQQNFSNPPMFQNCTNCTITVNITNEKSK